MVPLDAGDIMSLVPCRARTGCATIDYDPLSTGLDLTRLEAECVQLSPNVVIEKEMKRIRDHLTVIRQKIPGIQPQSTFGRFADPAGGPGIRPS